MPLHNPEACRRYAKVYEQHADETRDEARKAAMRALARDWRQMAEQAEGGADGRGVGALTPQSGRSENLAAW
jgi:hypothetical protein